jgi:hypothetical protein
MKCPVDWAHIDEDSLSWSVLQLDWYYSLAQYAVESSDLPFYPEIYEGIYEDTEDDIDYLKSTLINLRRTQPLAEDLYKKRRAGRLEDLQFMTPAEHGKHFIAGLGKEAAARRSKNGPSLFWENYSRARLRGAFWGGGRYVLRNCHEVRGVYGIHRPGITCIQESAGAKMAGISRRSSRTHLHEYTAARWRV